MNTSKIESKCISVVISPNEYNHRFFKSFLDNLKQKKYNCTSLYFDNITLNISWDDKPSIIVNYIDRNEIKITIIVILIIILLLIN